MRWQVFVFLLTTTYPPTLTCLPYKRGPKRHDFWTTYPPLLVNVVCEWPLNQNQITYWIFFSMDSKLIPLTFCKNIKASLLTIIGKKGISISILPNTTKWMCPPWVRFLTQALCMHSTMLLLHDVHQDRNLCRQFAIWGWCKSSGSIYRLPACHACAPSLPACRLPGCRLPSILPSPMYSVLCIDLISILHYFVIVSMCAVIFMEFFEQLQIHRRLSTTWTYSMTFRNYFAILKQSWRGNELFILKYYPPFTSHPFN